MRIARFVGLISDIYSSYNEKYFHTIKNVAIAKFDLSKYQSK